MRIAWPNLSLNPDAPSAWFRAYGASVRHRYVARFAGAPVSLPPLGRIPVSTSRSTDAEDLCGAIEALLEHLKPFVAHITDIDWKPKDGVLSLILRGMVRRQYDCLGAVTTLVRNGLGYAAAPMLRPACEEFIWATYLAQLQKAEAEELVSVVGHGEVVASLSAQDDYAGRKVTRELGLEAHLLKMRRSEPFARARLQKLGQKLGWEKRTVQSGSLPSVGYIAKQIGQTKLYNLLYHATSRFVHFSTSELLRRAWGKSGKVTICSDNFGEYWAAFTLHWGGLLLLRTTAAVARALENEMPENLLDAESLLRTAEEIADHGLVPIITAAELAWESNAP